MATSADIDLESLELGASVSLYSVSLAVTLGAMGSSEGGDIKEKTLELADKHSKDLKASIVRCGLPDLDVRLASEFKNATELQDYLFSEDFAQQIANRLVRKWGRRQEAIYRLAIRLTEGLAALQYGHSSTPKREELQELGKRIDLPSDLIDKWATNPLIALEEFREHMRRNRRAKVDSGELGPDHPISSTQNPWIAGSFYLATAVIIVALVGILAREIPTVALPIALLGGILLVILVGIFTLRQNEALRESSFSSLLVELMRRLPLLSTLMKRKNGDR